MYIINTLSDVRCLEASGSISINLIQYLERSIKAMHTVVKSKIPLAAFGLEKHGSIGILEPGDRSLAELGLPETLELLMPEWISRLVLSDVNYFVAYFLHGNGNCSRCLIPESIASDVIMVWLLDQPMEEEEWA
ncbi:MULTISPECIES: hypothetical protein [Pelosinus]|uniref:Uncharacterized protein n=1 Tax=Pelosinus fermentans B4 TaxID=1149862 RepID=I8RLR3_9FIRM|nr:MULTISPECIES: hypothetical protein [Pelosinus]EIW19600.1 hypothetical protein FB4_2783 [Pelosinus fermentans B4]EIW24666.1 hypothetical protein FA11_3057 [Pelosinus fermentans A11]OAM96053.1 hypothetical protein FR7_04075 [Pelosinus fermentans DSM 17108]SDR35829.1 hypothetical protein SAMN04515679_4245 [Pelosinus fermentans]